MRGDLGGPIAWISLGRQRPSSSSASRRWRSAPRRPGATTSPAPSVPSARTRPSRRPRTSHRRGRSPRGSPTRTASRRRARSASENSAGSFASGRANGLSSGEALRDPFRLRHDLLEEELRRHQSLGHPQAHLRDRVVELPRHLAQPRDVVLVVLDGLEGEERNELRRVEVHARDLADRHLPSRPVRVLELFPEAADQERLRQRLLLGEPGRVDRLEAREELPGLRRDRPRSPSARRPRACRSTACRPGSTRTPASGTGCIPSARRETPGTPCAGTRPPAGGGGRGSG